MEKGSPERKAILAGLKKTAATALKWDVWDPDFARALEEVLRDDLDKVGYPGKVVRPSIRLQPHAIGIGFRIGKGAWGAKHPDHKNAVSALKSALGSKWETSSTGGMTDVSLFLRTQ
jgi:hypothetical protein